MSDGRRRAVGLESPATAEAGSNPAWWFTVRIRDAALLGLSSQQTCKAYRVGRVRPRVVSMMVTRRWPICVVATQAHVSSARVPVPPAFRRHCDLMNRNGKRHVTDVSFAARPRVIGDPGKGRNVVMSTEGCVPWAGALVVETNGGNE